MSADQRLDQLLALGETSAFSYSGARFGALMVALGRVAGCLRRGMRFSEVDLYQRLEGAIALGVVAVRADERFGGRESPLAADTHHDIAQLCFADPRFHERALLHVREATRIYNSHPPAAIRRAGLEDRPAMLLQMEEAILQGRPDLADPAAAAATAAKSSD